MSGSIDIYCISFTHISKNTPVIYGIFRNFYASVESNNHTQKIAGPGFKITKDDNFVYCATCW